MNKTLIKNEPLLRIWRREDGFEKLEIKSFGSTGRNLYGQPARGHWKHWKWRKDGLGRRTLAELKTALKNRRIDER